MSKTDLITNLTISLIVAVILLLVAAVFVIYFHRKCRRLRKENQKKDDEYHDLKMFYDKLKKGNRNNPNPHTPPESRYSDPHPSPVQTWSKEEVKYEEPVKKEVSKVVRTKVYFPLSDGGLFFEKHSICDFNCVYEAEEVAPQRYEFTIISATKAKAWPIADAVSVVGSVLQQNAVDFKCIKKGEVMEREDDNHQLYWEITKKTEIEFTK